jgi:hypothetical protein
MAALYLYSRTACPPPPAGSTRATVRLKDDVHKTIALTADAVRAPHHSTSRLLLHSRASLSTCMSQGFLLLCDLLSGTFHVLFTCASNVVVELDYKRSVPFTCDSKVNTLDITTFPASSSIELISERNCSAPHMLLCFSSTSRHFLPSYTDFCIVSPCPSPSTGGHCNQLLWD